MKKKINKLEKGEKENNYNNLRTPCLGQDISLSLNLNQENIAKNEELKLEKDNEKLKKKFKI